jgi:competence protein ComEC
MRNRPAVKVLIPYLAGIVIADRFDFNPIYLWSLSAVLMISVFVAYKRKWFSSSSALIVLFLLFIGFFRYEIGMIPPAGIEEILYQQVEVQGVVIKSQKERSGGSSLIVKGKARSLSDPSIAMSGKISIRSWEEIFPQRYGNVVEIEGLLSQPRLPRNPGGFDYRKYLARRGIFATMNIENISDVQTVDTDGGNFFLRWVHGLREKMELVIDETMPSEGTAILTLNIPRKLLSKIVPNTFESAPFLKEMILGDRAALSPETRQAFIRTGTVHILVVSGLHVGIIAGWAFLVCNWIGKMFRLRTKSISYTLVIPVVLCYAMMIGFQSPIVRASILVILFVTATIMDRDRDLFNLLAVAALCILVYRPGAIFDAGFQLSFGVVASIVYLMPYWEKLLARIRNDKWTRHLLYRILQSIAVSWSAQIGAMLIIAHTFKRASLTGFAVNPIVVPPVGIIVPIGLATWITEPIRHSLATLLGYVNHISIYLINLPINYFSGLQWSEIPVRGFSFWHLVFSIALIVFITNLSSLLKQKRRLLISGIAIAAIFIWAMALSYDGHVLKATYLDVGQGDSIFVDLPNGRKILIDGGPYSVRFDTGKRVVAPFLQYEGVKSLDLVVSTHPHNDHAGGFTYLVQNEDNVNFWIGEVITGSYGLTTPTFQELRSRLDRRGIKYQDAQIGSIFKDDELHVEVVGPQYPDLSGDEDSRMNNNSVVLKVTYKGVSFLFASDIGEESERLLIDSGRDIRAQVLKVPHQGSEKSSSWEFLRAVQPYIGIISVGWNFFGHPSRLILGRYRWLGIKTYRTDERGAITVVTDGRRGWIKTKSGRGRGGDAEMWAL